MDTSAGPGPDPAPGTPATTSPGPGPGPDPAHGVPAPATGTTPDETPLLDTERVAPGRRRPGFGRVPLAWTVAIAADAIQWIVWPVFLAGAVSPADDIVDVVVAGVLLKLLGWHWAFLPSFVVKLIPVADFVPTWTMAVFIATRGHRKR
ncbi:MAG: hypothetical protein ACHQ52_11460 [Candidatus Eisenbacteria bacterium]